MPATQSCSLRCAGYGHDSRGLYVLYEQYNDAPKSGFADYDIEGHGELTVGYAYDTLANADALTNKRADLPTSITSGLPTRFPIQRPIDAHFKLFNNI